MKRILVVDDEEYIRTTIQEILELESYEVVICENGKKALGLIQDQKFNLIFCDIKMPVMTGIEFLTKALQYDPSLTIIIISGHGDIDTAVDALKKGAFDYIQKPIDLNRLLLASRNGLEREKLLEEHKVLKKKIALKHKMVGKSPKINEIIALIKKAAPTDARIMITGSNGTGKEVAAQMIHEQSNRKNKPFVEVNCAAIPSELIESELFGHEKGSFTSAIKQRIGKFEQAHNGTLFLDEVGDMNLSAQAKVLRALQEKTITRVGGDKNISVDVRVISATNKNLEEEIKAGRFREDLFHRLTVIPIHMPTLKERSTDIPLLIDYFITQISEEQGTAKKIINKDSVELLKKKEWTGNIRELRNVVERLIILSDEIITKEDVLQYS